MATEQSPARSSVVPVAPVAPESSEAPEVLETRSVPALEEIRGVLVVVAHPDDESFGLGAILSRLRDAGARTAVLCFTRGEASTLHGADGDLAEIRAAELAEAGTVLGVGRTELLDHPDGALDGVPLEELTREVLRLVDELRPSHLLVFDRGGVTGHPDHDRATVAALAAAGHADLPVLAWALPDAVTNALNDEFGTAFAGRPDGELDLRLSVDRTVQWEAIRRHASQSTGNPVLYRRLQLLGDTEHLRLLHWTRAAGRSGSGPGRQGLG